MLKSASPMFCPQCQAEYLPHVRRCSDCGVPLVEQVPVSYPDSDRERTSGFLFFKRNGVFIVMPVSFLTFVLVLVALRDNPFEIQIAIIVWGTSFAFLSVFCDLGPGKGVGKGTKGYSLGEKAVRQKLPLFLRIHGGILVLIISWRNGGVLVTPPHVVCPQYRS
jgi:hypothetical protein